jgi:hypothetical protein
MIRRPKDYSADTSSHFSSECFREMEGRGAFSDIESDDRKKF